jgi:ABC-type sugar transport system substrate-binding protein
MYFKHIALLLLATLTVACSDSGKPTPTAPAPFKVTVVLKSFANPFFVELAKGARLAQTETGIDRRCCTDAGMNEATPTPKGSMTQGLNCGRNLGVQRSACG